MNESSDQRPEKEEGKADHKRYYPCVVINDLPKMTSSNTLVIVVGIDLILELVLNTIQ